MGKKSKKKRVTLRWFARQLMFRVMPWVLLIWVTIVFITANNSAVLKPLPLRADVLALERQLKDEVKPGANLVRAQDIRYDLIIEYINQNQLVKAREQLLTFKNWVETNPNFSLTERINMHRQLSIIHTSLGEFEPAVNEYSIILDKELEGKDDPDSQRLKALYYNNRGVANFFLSQGSEKEEMRKKYLTASSEDFQASQSWITASNKSKAALDSNGYLEQIVTVNKRCLDDDAKFTPLKSQP